MAVIKKDYSYMEFPLSIKRQDAFPIDKDSVFYSLAEAQEYASSSPLAYPTQVIGVIDETSETAKPYVINFDGSITELGSGGSGSIEWGTIQ